LQPDRNIGRSNGFLRQKKKAKKRAALSESASDIAGNLERTLSVRAE
jgi:hypothetical protein